MVNDRVTKFLSMQGRIGLSGKGIHRKCADAMIRRLMFAWHPEPEPGGEPVAWQCQIHGMNILGTDGRCPVISNDGRSRIGAECGANGRPLYAHPPTGEPMGWLVTTADSDRLFRKHRPDVVDGKLASREVISIVPLYAAPPATVLASIADEMADTIEALLVGMPVEELDAPEMRAIARAAKNYRVQVKP